MMKVNRIECRGEGEYLLFRFTDANGEQHELAFDANKLNELFRNGIGAVCTPSAPQAMRDLSQLFSPRELRVTVHAGATPIVHLELEAGVATGTTIDRHDLLRLRDECDAALSALPPDTAH